MADKNLSVTVSANVNGKQVGEIIAKPKTFSTGSVGFYASDKVVINGERYQVTCNLVKVGSGKKADAPKA